LAKALGEYLHQQQQGNFQPFFTLSHESEEEDEVGYPVSHAGSSHTVRTNTSQRFIITSDMIKRMANRGIFDMDSFELTIRPPTSLVHISLGLKGPDVHGSHTMFPISGFPRALLTKSQVQSMSFDTFVL
jgi:hypothetical protein